MRIFIKGILHFVVLVLFRVKKVGEDNVPDEGSCILCPNHVSNWDPITVVVTSKRQVRMMAKEELFKSKFLSWVAKVFGMFPVKRGKQDLEAIKNSLRVLKAGQILSLYPEGTRKGLEKGIKPKNGAVLIAVKAKVPIIPVGIQGDFKLFKKVKINYGKPIYYDESKIDVQDKEHIDNLTKDLMQEIIKLTKENV